MCTVCVVFCLAFCGSGSLNQCYFFICQAPRGNTKSPLLWHNYMVMHRSHNIHTRIERERERRGETDRREGAYPKLVPFESHSRTAAPLTSAAFSGMTSVDDPRKVAPFVGSLTAYRSASRASTAGALVLSAIADVPHSDAST